MCTSNGFQAILPSKAMRMLTDWPKPLPQAALLHLLPSLQSCKSHCQQASWPSKLHTANLLPQPGPTYGEIRHMLQNWPTSPPVSPITPSPDSWLAYGLPCHGTSIMTQLLTGHVALNTFLKKICATDSVLCPHCRLPETISHFLLYCSKFASHHRYLRAKIGITSTSVSRMLSDTKCLSHMLCYIANTKQLKDYIDVAPRPTQ